MLDTALNHLPLALTFVTLLIAHMLRFEEIVSPVPNRRTQSLLPQPVFSHRQMNGETLLVDPDGRASRLNKR